jgi:hypothetical protein
VGQARGRIGAAVMAHVFRLVAHVWRTDARKPVPRNGKPALTCVGVAGFEPAASSSRSQCAMWPTTTLTLSDLLRIVRGHPLASAGVCGGCYSVGYSPAKGRGG